jgi:hypothetical protein
MEASQVGSTVALGHQTDMGDLIPAYRRVRK